MGIGPKEFGDKLLELLPRLMQKISRYENNYVTSGKITCQQVIALDKLSQKKEWKMNEFVQAMNSSFSTITEMIGRLVKHGLARRTPGKEDRRTVYVQITAKGHKILDEIYRQKKQGIIQLFKRLSAQERQEYLRIIGKLVQSLSSVESNT